jgi:hypothetical protein
MPLRTGEVKDERLATWGFERAIPADLAIDAAPHEVEPPDLALALVANRGDHITVQVLEGQPPLPDGFIYVKAARTIRDRACREVAGATSRWDERAAVADPSRLSVPVILRR